MRIGSLLAMVLLFVVSIAHFMRLVFRIEIIAGGFVVPLWISAVGLVAPMAISILLWIERRRPS